jgi:hypothetical protein
MEITMSTTNKVPKSFTLAAIGWGIIALAVIGGTGYKLGIQHQIDEAKHDAQIIKAATATPAPVLAAEVPKN